MPFHTEQQRATHLSPAREALVLSVFPPGATVQKARFFDNYSLPCPVRVDVAWPGGSASVALRAARHGDMAREADILRALRRLGLPVPEVLAESGSEDDPGEPAAVLGLLPGTNLQALSEASPEGLEMAQALLIEAVARLSDLTGRVEGEPVARQLPRYTLTGQLADVAASASPWLKEPGFRGAVETLEPCLRRIDAPLVFTNGDYQPANFLAEDGRLSGFVDFESACFQDPLIGFAKYPIYDVHPLNRAGFIDRLLAARGWTRADFAPRLALGCLMTLLREIPVQGGDAEYRAHVLRLLRDALEDVNAI